MARNSTLDMTEGSPFKLIIKFSLPLVLGNVLQQLYNLVDSVVVGNFAADGIAALEAVNNGFGPFFLFASFFIGLSMGATVVTARAFGKKDFSEIQKIGDTVYSLIIPMGIVLGVVSVLLVPAMMRLMNVTDYSSEYTKVYLEVALGGVVGVIGFNVNSGIMQGMGDTKTPLLLLAITSALNVVLDLIFVIIFHWDTFGVAFATIISQFISWLFGLFYINRKYKGMLNLNPFRLRAAHGYIMKEVLRLGIPSALYNASVAIGSMFVMRVVNAAGMGSGFGCAHKIDAFCILPMQSISNGAMTFAGQNLGAGKPERLNKGIWHSMLLIFISYAIVASIATIFSKQLVSIFIDDADVISTGAGILMVFMPFYFLLGLMFLFGGILRGVGKPMMPFIATFISTTVLRYVIAVYFYDIFGDVRLFYSYPLTWLLSCLILAPMIIFGKWRRRQPEPCRLEPQTEPPAE